MQVHTKLHINLSEGVVDVEGDPALVREVYADFKTKLLEGNDFSPRQEDNTPIEKKRDTPKSKPKRRSRGGKQTSSKESSGGIDPNKPKLDKTLDMSKLPSFYNQFVVKNHQEKILVFLKFLTENLSIQSPNTDQVYTCYEETKERLPTAYAQAFRKASGRNFGYIDYNSPSDLTITIRGNNHFQDLLKRNTE